MPVNDVRRYGTLTAALVTVGLALTACDAVTTSSGGEAASAPTVAESSPAIGAEPTPTAVPTVQPTPASAAAPAANLSIPTKPEGADEQTREGFQAFTEHWLELLSYSYEANDLEPLYAVSDPACQFCKDSEAAMAQIYQLGWASGGQTTLTGFVTDFTPDSAGVYTADITTTQGEIFYYSGKGWLGSSESRPDTAHTVTARYSAEGWQMIDYASPEVPTSEVPPSETADPGH